MGVREDSQGLTRACEPSIMFFQCMTPGEGWKFLHGDIERRLGPGTCKRLWPYLCIRWPKAHLSLPEFMLSPVAIRASMLALDEHACWQEPDRPGPHCAPCWHHVLAARLGPDQRRRFWEKMQSLNPHRCRSSVEHWAASIGLEFP